MVLTAEPYLLGGIMISIVVPCYNEEEAIPFFYPELKKYSYQIPHILQHYFQNLMVLVYHPNMLYNYIGI